MRTAKLTHAEILEAEKAVDARKNFRQGGYDGMKLRDQGSTVLSNGVQMLWTVPKPVFPDKGLWVYPRNVADGTFILKIDGKEHVFDTEEFRKWLRWA